MDLAHVLEALGRLSSARVEAEVALAVFTGLGARPDAEKASRFLAGKGLATGSPPADPSGLTPREVEALRLVARGKSNQEIADMLVLSTRTVERHISTIYGKLGLSGKVARASATAYALRHNIVPSAG